MFMRSFVGAIGVSERYGTIIIIRLEGLILN